MYSQNIEELLEKVEEQGIDELIYGDTLLFGKR
jgi:hypothetical protein